VIEGKKMNRKISDRIINCFRDRLEDLRLEGQITRDQENLIWYVFNEIVVTAKYKNPFKVIDYDKARKEQSQPIKAILTGESISDLKDFCCCLETSISRFLSKIEDREDYLKKMKLLTSSERDIRKTLVNQFNKLKSELLKGCSFLSDTSKSLKQISPDP